MRPVLVSESFRRRTTSGKESKEARQEDSEKLEQRRAVKVEGVVAQIDRR